MNRKSWRLFAALTAGLCTAALFYDWRISLGFILGAFVSVLLYFRTVMFCDTVLGQKKAGKGFVFSRFMSSYALMAIPLILSVVLPEYFNVFAAAAGLLLIKVTLMLDSLLERREKDE